MPIGATSYVFRYLLSEPSSSPRLNELVRMARAAGLERFQICENARPLDLDRSGWEDLNEHAKQLGLHITLGCMTLDPQVVAAYLDRVHAIEGNSLRIVLEREGPAFLTQTQIRSFLDSVAPLLESKGIRLAIENHFEIPAKLLAESVEPYPRELIGFCIDAANSLRNFEDWNRVFDLLGHRAVAFHLKDFQLFGTNIGFTVSGAPFGDGRIGTSELLERVFDISSEPEIYLETWTPCTGNRGADIEADSNWLRLSIENLKRALVGREKCSPKASIG